MSSMTETNDVATLQQIRDQFPALTRVQSGNPVAYFDGPGGTQVPRAVADAITDYLLHHNANTHWAYPSSEETDAILAGAREAVADFLHCGSDEVVFGANMTTLTFHLARALGRTWAPGDEVVVTELDHHANVAPWRALETDRGIVVRTARMIPDSGQLDYDHLQSLLGPKTRLLAAGGACNALGTMTDLKRLSAAARSVGALFFLDAVHLAPHELIDVREAGCDFLACSSYKFYGPHAGILFGRSELLQTLPFPKLACSPDSAPDRAETGTQNHEGIAGIRATIDFLASLGGSEGGRRERLRRAYDGFHRQGTKLVRALWEGLSLIDGVRMFGPPPAQPRTPTVSFTLRGVSAEEVCRNLAAQGLFVSHGDFYAQTVIERLKVEALVRIGCACYTSEEEVARLVDAVRRMATL